MRKFMVLNACIREEEDFQLISSYFMKLEKKRAQNETNQAQGKEK